MSSVPITESEEDEKLGNVCVFYVWGKMFFCLNIYNAESFDFQYLKEKNVGSTTADSNYFYELRPVANGRVSYRL